MKLKKKLTNKAKNQIASLLNEAMRAYLINQLNVAEQRCQKILLIQANNPDACNLLGKIAEKRGGLEAAKIIYEQSQQCHPNHRGLLASLGLLHSKLESHQQAIQQWQRLVKLNPNNADAWQALSSQWYLLRQWDKAEESARKAIKLGPSRGELHTNLGRILRMQRRLDEACINLNKAIELAPDNIDARYELAMSTMESGEMDEAFEMFRNLLKIDPRHTPSLFMMMRFKKMTSHNEVMEQAATLFNDPSEPINNRALLAFGLGKAWEDLKEYDKSFTYYAEGNRIRRESIGFDISDEWRNLKETKNLFNEKIFSRHQIQTSNAEGLFFIVGMPRTGSTLLDKILAVHPNVVDIGETDDLREVVGSLTNGDRTNINQQNLLQATDAQLASAAESYLDRIHRFFGESENYIDKTLPNMWLVGFIHLLFPNAKILHCSRNPLDNCFSIFSTDFEGSFFRFAYNLQELGEYYRVYRDMMEHWHNVLPSEAYYEVSYESLVASPEEESRRLIKFCGLDWDDACLNFHESKQAVQTSSLAQVRQPIYKSSIERWKRYEKHLQPLIDALGDTVQQPQAKS